MAGRAPRSIPLRDRSSAALRCAPFRASLAVDPVGTAGAYDAFLAVEVPLPWSRDISADEPFRSLLPAGRSSAPSLEGAAGRQWRPVGLVPRSGSGDGSVTVLAFEPAEGAGPGDVAPLVRSEWCLPPGRVADLCAALVTGDPDRRRAHDAALVDTPADLVELLVCTHGHRDVCCGGAGTSLHRELAAELERDPSVRLWRCSHTGGHRFAPTALTFPDGYAWAHLDVATALAVARRSSPAAAVAASCRGSSLVPGGPEQAADREALARLGWGWAALPRSVRRVGPAPHGEPVGGDPAVGDLAVVRVSGRGADGPVELEVTVEVAELVPTPTCGTAEGPDAPGTGVEPVWRVRAVAQ